MEIISTILVILSQFNCKKSSENLGGKIQPNNFNKKLCKKIIPNNVRDTLFHYYNCSQNEAFFIPQINEAICNKMSEL